MWVCGRMYWHLLAYVLAGGEGRQVLRDVVGLPRAAGVLKDGQELENVGRCGHVLACVGGCREGWAGVGRCGGSGKGLGGCAWVGKGAEVNAGVRRCWHVLACATPASSNCGRREEVCAGVCRCGGAGKGCSGPQGWAGMWRWGQVCTGVACVCMLQRPRKRIVA
jgi:hypothetical protein